jgi:hypothetical protein
MASPYAQYALFAMSCHYQQAAPMALGEPRFARGALLVSAYCSSQNRGDVTGKKVQR